MIDIIYAYCTDFVINLANLIGLSYYEINLLLFCVLYPLVLLSLIVIYFIQKRRLKKLMAPNQA
ncbi:MAG: hypothetical protein ACI8ZM_003953 [Crocinitomix sp.]|jgi:hypothetical protein